MKTFKYQIVSLAAILLFVSGTFKARAQQDPMYSQYMFNKLIYNPAYAGTDPKFICATFLLHNQWAGFSGTGDEYSGLAPSTQTFSMHAPIPNSNTFGGLGLIVINDKLGYEYMTTAELAMSLKHNFTFGTVQLGVNGGMIQRGINNTYWKYPQSATDPRIAAGQFSDMVPDLGAGLYIFAENKFYFGLSSQHLIGGKFTWGGVGGTQEVERHSYVTAGYNFILPSNPSIEFQPSFLYKIEKAKSQFEINLNVLYKSMFWGGLQYRQGDAVTALLGMKLTPQLMFGYAYDITTTSLNQYSNGSHEIFINYCFTIKTKEKIFIPNIIWTPRYLKQ